MLTIRQQAAVILEDHLENPAPRLLSEWDVEHARENRINRDLQAFGSDAIAIAHAAGIFNFEHQSTVYLENPTKAGIDDMKLFMDWSRQMMCIIEDESVPVGNGIAGETILPSLPEIARPVIHAAVTRIPAARLEPSKRPNLTFLNKDQRRAHDIVEQDILANLNGDNSEQLLMLVLGQGGTGKSVVINAISETFAEHNASHMLAKTATSGVAASLIGGQTTFSFAGMGIKTPPLGDWLSSAPKATTAKRYRNIVNKRTLIVDECSMLTKVHLACLSEVISHVRYAHGQGDPALPFGGMNVILFGDFHQFPPIQKSGALYDPTISEKQQIRSAIGLEIFNQFKTVINLTEQKRVTDLVWKGILDRLREGECTEEDMKEVKKLIMKDENGAQAEPWPDSVLVTSRHSVREAWNDAAIAKHCTTSGHRLFISPAEDTIGRSRTPLSLPHRVLVAGMKSNHTGNLSDQVKIAVGMRVMVTLNLSTERDLANGTRGIIEDIILDPRETLKEPDENGAIRLDYPPAMILFRPNIQVTHHFKGLKLGLLPISPSEKGFKFFDQAGHKISVTRRQVSITPAYAFTDYKSQGQTIPILYLDIANPPGGKLDPFNAYVALSRGKGRSSIKLIWGFDDALFTNHPSDKLRVADAKFAMLASETAARFP